MSQEKVHKAIKRFILDLTNYFINIQTFLHKTKFTFPSFVQFYIFSSFFTNTFPGNLINRLNKVTYISSMFL